MPETMESDSVSWDKVLDLRMHLLYRNISLRFCDVQVKTNSQVFG